MNLLLAKDEKYILTCSFGPDSMCLFDMLIKGHYDFMVVHVNYHLRKEEPEEVKILEKLCKENQIHLDILDVWMPSGVNEEGWAREVRYNYFSDVALKYCIKNVLVAHNEDDLLETYLLQKRRKNAVSFYGLRESYFFKNAKIIRPFLRVKKADLRKHCDENNVPYGLDLSNFDTSYARNKIRKEIVKDMPRDKRDALLLEIKTKNEAQEKMIDRLQKFIVNREIDIKKIDSLKSEEFYMLLILYFESEKLYRSLSRKFSDELYTIVKEKSTWHYKLNKKCFLSLDYGILRIYQLKTLAYSFDSSSDLIKINKDSSLYEMIEGQSIIIRNDLRSNEIYEYKGLKKKVGRCFIDWKVPYVYRLLWPGIYNKEGKILYIPHYQKDFKNNADSLLIYNLDDLLK